MTAAPAGTLPVVKRVKVRAPIAIGGSAFTGTPATVAAESSTRISSEADASVRVSSTVLRSSTSYAKAMRLVPGAMGAVTRSESPENAMAPSPTSPSDGRAFAMPAGIRAVKLAPRPATRVTVPGLETMITSVTVRRPVAVAAATTTWRLSTTSGTPADAVSYTTTLAGPLPTGSEKYAMLAYCAAAMNTVLVSPLERYGMPNRPPASVRTESTAPAESRPMRCSVTQTPAAGAFEIGRAHV